MRHKNNLRQPFLATPTSALTALKSKKEGGYGFVKNDLRQHIFYKAISPH